MTAGFVAAQRTDHGVPHAVACRALGVPESTFYKWRGRSPTPAEQRRAGLDAGSQGLLRTPPAGPTARPGCGPSCAETAWPCPRRPWRPPWRARAFKDARPDGGGGA